MTVPETCPYCKSFVWHRSEPCNCQPPVRFPARVTYPVTTHDLRHIYDRTLCIVYDNESLGVLGRALKAARQEYRVMSAKDAAP